MHGLSGTPSRLPSQWHEFHALGLTYLKSSCHEQPPLLHQLPPSQYQDVFSAMGGNRDVKNGRREATMVMVEQ